MAQPLTTNPHLAILETYVRGQAELGYTAFDPGPDPSDVILVSFPKSGSTWISYLLHQLRSNGDEEFSDIKNAVIDITPGHWDPRENPFLINQSFSPRTFKTHGRHTLAPTGGKFIYVARDPRDCFLSLYHFLHDLFGLEEQIGFSDFLKHYFVERFGTGHDIANPWEHFLSWYPHRSEDNFLWLHYEDLLENRRACLKAIARFMGVDLTDDLLDLVLQRSEMDHTRSLAHKLNPSQSNKTGQITLTFGDQMRRYARGMKFGKMRKGRSGEGQDVLPAHILAQLDEEWRTRITPRLGFTDYADMRKACSLLRREDLVPETR